MIEELCYAQRVEEAIDYTKTEIINNINMMSKVKK